MLLLTSKLFSGTMGAVIALGLAMGAQAQTVPLSAQESDPNVMGWMQGFPPGASRRTGV